MDREISSRNFAFLKEYDPLIEEYGLRAELNAYTDPNTSLIKSRQLGTLLALSTAAHAGMDCADSKFADVLQLLKRQRIISRLEFGLFDRVRLYGNAAAHEHRKDCTAALQTLVCAYELAKWFYGTVLESDDRNLGPFKPPAAPRDGPHELQEEIEFLQQEAARELATAQSEVETLTCKLEEEAREYQSQIDSQRALLNLAKSELERMEQESNKQLRQIAEVATSKPFQSFIERSATSAKRIGRLGNESLPVMQIRIPGGSTCSQCNLPMLVTQSMHGGFITQNCPKCSSPENLGQFEFQTLPIRVACESCRRLTEATMIGRNYGYKCLHCGWQCELAALVPHYDEVGYTEEAN